MQRMEKEHDMNRLGGMVFKSVIVSHPNWRDDITGENGLYSANYVFIKGKWLRTGVAGCYIYPGGRNQVYILLSKHGTSEQLPELPKPPTDVPYDIAETYYFVPEDGVPKDSDLCFEKPRNVWEATSDFVSSGRMYSNEEIDSFRAQESAEDGNIFGGSRNDWNH